jgi:tartrate dehydrogenase/decarboxylase/D-malate dehydrogenase
LALSRVAGRTPSSFGAAGVPEISDKQTLWGLLMPTRRGFGLSVNVCPVRSYVGVGRPVVTDREIDMVIVRENVEGELQ